MDHLRYSSFNLGFRVIQFLIPSTVVGLSHNVGRVLCSILMNGVSCTKILQKYSYFHNCASSNNASIPKGISTEYADANRPGNGFSLHHNHVNSENQANGAQNKSNTPLYNNGDIRPAHIQLRMGGQGNGNGGDVNRETVVIERRNSEGFLIETIETHICALDYHTWSRFAGAIFNFRRLRDNLVFLPLVEVMDPLLIWAGSFPYYGHWNGEYYTFWDWDDYEWNTVNGWINVIVLRELEQENDGANNEEGANGALNDVEGANNVAQNGGVDANHGGQNGGEGTNTNAAQNEGEGDSNGAQNGAEGANNGAQIEGEGNMAAQMEGGGDKGAQNEEEGDNAEQTEGGGVNAAQIEGDGANAAQIEGDGANAAQIEGDGSAQIERGANDQKRKFSDVD